MGRSKDIGAKILTLPTVIYGEVYEPQHDKTNKVTVRPAKTQISLGICPVWSEFTVRLMGS